MNHKSYQIFKNVDSLEGYASSVDGKKFLAYHIFGYNNTYISDTRPEVSSKGLTLKILYEGNASDIPSDIVDELLVTNDSSENPLRPFRWYRYTMHCAMTDDPESIKKVRGESFSKLLEKIENPAYIWIYEILET